MPGAAQDPTAGTPGGGRGGVPGEPKKKAKPRKRKSAEQTASGEGGAGGGEEQQGGKKKKDGKSKGKGPAVEAGEAVAGAARPMTEKEETTAVKRLGALLGAEMAKTGLAESERDRAVAKAADAEKEAKELKAQMKKLKEEVDALKKRLRDAEGLAKNARKSEVELKAVKGKLAVLEAQAESAALQDVGRGGGEDAVAAPVGRGTQGLGEMRAALQATQQTLAAHEVALANLQAEMTEQRVQGAAQVRLELETIRRETGRRGGEGPSGVAQQEELERIRRETRRRGGEGPSGIVQ